MRYVYLIGELGPMAAKLVLGMILYGIFLRAVLFIIDRDVWKDIDAGKTGPAVVMAGATLGFMYPLSAVMSESHIVEFVLAAAIAMIVQSAWLLASFWRMRKRIDTDNTAAAIVYAASAVGFGLLTGPIAKAVLISN